MIDTSQAYKELVYSTLYARHFIPRVLMKVIDNNARSGCSYSSASSAFTTNFAQLINEVYSPSYAYGTLEDGLFNLAGNKILMPDEVSSMGEVGYMSEVMSDENGNFVEPLQALICTYTTQISTVGRTLFFDDTVDFVPKDFDLIYYRDDVEVARSSIHDNALYIYSDLLGVKRYNRLIIVVYSTTVGYRHVRIIEDIPGVYLLFKDDGVVSININQSVDVFMEELVAGEVDVTVENASKILDILNTSGYEAFLQRRQAIEISLQMEFPDLSIEEIPIGNLQLITWKSNKGALAVTFTARDILDKLSLDEYIKGTVRTTPVSYYALAEAVLIDAGVTNYVIDSQLMTMYTYACLPIASHKELLRMIAQASQSVVLPTVNGGIHIKFFATALNESVVPVDSLDYSVLLDSPEISTLEATKSVEVEIYSYTTATATSEVYSGIRTISGTEKFTIKFSGIAVNYSVKVESLDANGNVTAVNTATLVTSELYAQAAVLTVTANSDVQITVTGYAVSTDTSAYKIDGDIDPSLIPEAQAITIDNKLITSKVTAIAIASYATYWYNKIYQYDFDWRQNPAVELLDTVTVHDDFDNDNNILITERNIEYTDGVISGSSKGIC